MFLADGRLGGAVTLDAVITELAERGVPCQCLQPGCTCANDADSATDQPSALAAWSTARTSTRRARLRWRL